MQKTGNISEHDMFNTFNMGVGMVLTVPAEQADKRWTSCTQTVSRKLTVWVLLQKVRAWSCAEHCSFSQKKALLSNATDMLSHPFPFPHFPHSRISRLPIVHNKPRGGKHGVRP